jgi:hypothetical protein
MNDIKDETLIVTLTVGQLKQIISNEIKKVIAIQENIITPQVPEIFGAKTFKEITGYSFASIYAKTSKNELKHFKRGGKLFFRRDDVMDWLTSNPIATADEHCSLMDEKLVKNGRGKV